MVADNADHHRTAFTVSVDACAGTGISAVDRAATARALADPEARPADFRRPGHMFPLRAHPDGIGGRAGHTEASLELALRAGVQPVTVISELMNEWGEPAGRNAAEAFAQRFGLPIVDTAELLAPVEPVAPIRLPTEYGTFETSLVREPDGLEHLILTLGDIDSGRAGPRPHPLRVRDRRPVRVTSLRLRRPAAAVPRADRGGRRGVSSSTSEDTRAGASGSRTSSAPTRSRTRAPTRSMPTCASACRPTLVTSSRRRGCWPTSESSTRSC